MADGSTKAVGHEGRVDSPLRGILLMIAAVSLFSLLDVTAKMLAGPIGLPPTQIVWMRFVGQFVLILVVVGLANLPRLLSTHQLRWQFLRSVLLLASTAFNFLALRDLRLDQTTAIAFMAPLLVALLAGPFLGEWIGVRRLIAIMVGFLGILVVVRPGMGGFHPAMLFSMASVFSYAAFMLLTRHMSAFDKPEVTLFYSLFAGTFLVAPLAFFDWVWPADALTWALLLTMGLWGGIGHYLFILAHRHAPASTVAPFIYTQILGMSALGFVVFGDLPDIYTLAGSVIVIASGVYLVHRERVTAAKRAAAAAAAVPGKQAP